MAFPEYIMAKLRQRRGLNPRDTSEDDKIARYNPRKALNEILTWELGYSSWADTVIRWARDCGMEINENSGKVDG